MVLTFLLKKLTLVLKKYSINNVPPMLKLIKKRLSDLILNISNIVSTNGIATPKKRKYNVYCCSLDSN
jgi:hypothetical protein